MIALVKPKLRFPEFTNSWQQVTVGEVFDFKNGRAHEQDIDDSGEFIVVNSKFISTQGSVKKYSLTQIEPLYKDDIVMVMSDIPNGKALAKCYLIEADGRYTLNQRICGLTVKKGAPLYYLYQVNRNHYYLRFDSGVGQTNLKKQEVLDCPIFIADVNEQLKIADFLSAVDEKIALLEKKKELMEKYKKGVMQQIFSQKIRFKDDSNRQYPAWQPKKIKDISSVMVGGTPSTTKSEYWGGSVGWINSGAINNGLVITASKQITELGLKKSAATLMPKDTVLLAMTGATLGRIGMLMFECSGNQSVAGVLPNSSFHEWFLFYNIQYNNHIIFKYAAGAAQPGITKTTIENFEFLFPIFEEQKKIGDLLLSIDTKTQKLSEYIATTKTWKKGLLQQMFV